MIRKPLAFQITMTNTRYRIYGTRRWSGRQDRDLAEHICHNGKLRDLHDRNLGWPRRQDRDLAEHIPGIP